MIGWTTGIDHFVGELLNLETLDISGTGVVHLTGVKPPLLSVVHAENGVLRSIHHSSWLHGQLWIRNVSASLQFPADVSVAASVNNCSLTKCLVGGRVTETAANISCPDSLLYRVRNSTGNWDDLGVVYILLEMHDVFASTLCHCDTGTYTDMLIQGSCVVCPLGYFCQSGRKLQCPEHWTTISEGSTKASACSVYLPVAVPTPMWVYFCYGFGLLGSVLALVWFGLRARARMVLQNTPRRTVVELSHWHYGGTSFRGNVDDFSPASRVDSNPSDPRAGWDAQKRSEQEAVRA